MPGSGVRLSALNLQLDAILGSDRMQVRSLHERAPGDSGSGSQHSGRRGRQPSCIERRAGEAHFVSGELHALSVFFCLGDDVFHTYSAYARGTEGLTDAYSLLDVTPYGRQEDFEDSPPGWPQKPTYG